MEEENKDGLEEKGEGTIMGKRARRKERDRVKAKGVKTGLDGEGKGIGGAKMIKGREKRGERRKIKPKKI